MSTETKNEILFKNKSVVLSWIEELGILEISWIERSSNEGYLEILNKQLEFAKAKGAKKVLYDLRNMGVISMENQAYTNDVYFVEMAKAGNKYSAVVVPENVFGELSAKKILGEKGDKLFTAEVFDDPKQALKWLRDIDV